MVRPSNGAFSFKGHEDGLIGLDTLAGAGRDYRCARRWWAALVVQENAVGAGPVSFA